jgi:hypothetical protein
MDILQKILAHKEKEVAERKSLFPTKLLEESPMGSQPAPLLALKEA